MAKRNGFHTFAAIPKRWVVGRTISWLEKCRRFWKNCERKLSSSLAMIRLAFTSLLPGKTLNGFLEAGGPGEIGLVDAVLFPEEEERAEEGPEGVAGEAGERGGDGGLGRDAVEIVKEHLE